MVVRAWRTELRGDGWRGLTLQNCRSPVADWLVFDDRNAMIGVKLAERLNVQPGASRWWITTSVRICRLKCIGVWRCGRNMLIVSPDGAGLAASAGQNQPRLLSVSNDVGQVENYASRLQAQYPDLRFVRCRSRFRRQVLDKIKGLMGLVSIVILALSSLCVNTADGAIVGERARVCAAKSAWFQQRRYRAANSC